MQLPTLAPCLVVLALLAVAWPGHASPHDHGHEGGEAAAAGHVVATPAQRWTTDAPLRAGMRDIRNVVEADAALHVVLAGLAQGANALANDPADPGAIQSMRQALADYARFFDDPVFEVPSA